MARKYGRHFYRDFGNTYELGYTDGDLPDGWEQITRKKAEEMARAESQRQKDDPAFSGYADTYILPIGLSEEQIENAIYDARWGSHRRWKLSGRVIERVTND